MSKKYYLTTPLYYVNAKPHIGHAYTNILCDAFARFHRACGEKVFFMTGTDEHGTKIEKSAEEQGMEPQAYVDSIVPHFEHLWKSLGIEYDYFIRTTAADHKKTVQTILSELEAKGQIYKAKYEGWYSVKSETFYSEKELVDGKCPDTGGEVQKIEEENYFFKMSEHQQWLIDHIEANDDFIQPQKRRNEILSFLKNEDLQDLCITRPKERLKWGIDYPGSDSHVVYVWFDALINYISGIGYKTDDARFDQHWPVDAHVLGKDIIRHHAVYWPIMLHACGLEPPKKLLVHGWWTISGEKVSKSSGNVIDPIELIEKYGIDAVRYFMLKGVTVGEDGAYSEELLRKTYRTDLVNDLGNLWFRTASMLAKYFDSKVPEVNLDENEKLIEMTYKLWDKVQIGMNSYDPKISLQTISNVVVQANVFVDENKPWALAKDPEKKEELARVLVTLLETLAHVAVLLQPFVPETAAKILQRLQLPEQFPLNDESAFKKCLLQSGAEVERGEVLFRGLAEIDEKDGAKS